MSEVKLIKEKDYIKILPEHQKWKNQLYRETYWNTDALKIPEGTKQLVESANIKYSSINRERIPYRLSQFYLDTMNTITSVITILDKTNGKNIICGFVYSKQYSSIDYKLVDPLSNSILLSDKMMSYYYNIGPSLESVDGEYRSQFSDFTGLFKVKLYYKDLYSEITEYLKKNINKRKYAFHRETYFPTAKIKQYEIDLDKHFHTNQMELNLYFMQWYIGVYQKLTNIREDHVNQRYVKFMDKHMKEDIQFFEKLIKKYTSNTMKIVYRYFEYICLPGKNYTTVLGMGQKLMPLNLLEVQRPFDARFVPWRDYLISQALTNLVVNNICPGFPVVNSWMYIKGTKKGLFNNRIQYQKIERSDQAVSIIELLVKAKSYTYQNIKSADMKKMRGTITSWLSDKFKFLHDQIDDAINFGKNEIIMSNVSFMIIGEYAGRTLNDALRLTKSSPYYNNSLGQPFTSSGYKYFKKYIFDLCYNLYCMHEYYGIIHGDLHLNNLTLYQKFDPDHENFSSVKNPHVAYVLGKNNEYCFVVPSLAYHTTIIDFGRSFIHPDKLDRIKDPTVPKKYEITGNRDKFQKEQIYRLIRTYIKLVPGAKDQEPELKVLFTKNFNAMYKLMSVIDLYSVATKLNTIFGLKHPDIVNPHSNCIFLIKKIIELCNIYLVSDVSKLISDKAYGDSIEESNAPLLDIIIKLFSDNLHDPVSESSKTIIDVFLYNNPLKHSLGFLSKNPPIMSKKKYEDSDGKLVEFSSVGIENNKKTRKIYEESRVKNYDTVDFIAQRHKEKIF
jgi:hypothetical protein